MANHKITVTELQHAVLDPDWRARWLAGEKPSTRPIVTSDIGFSVKGQNFHLVAQQFTQWLAKGRAKKTALSLIEPHQLWHECYERFAITALNQLVEKGELQSAHHLSGCWQAFCARLSELRKAMSSFSDWQDLLFAEEMAIQSVEIDAFGIEVSGRVDSVRNDPERGVMVIDYKLSQGANAKHDLVQLAIYAQMLERTKPGLAFTGMLEYYQPQLKVVTVTPEDLRKLFDDQVLPVIQAMAEGLSTPRPTKPNEPETVSPDLTDNPNSKPSPDYSDQITQTFRAFKLDVSVIDRIEAPQLYRYKVRPAPGIKVVSLANRAEDLQVNLALQSPPRIEPAPGFISIDVPKSKPDTVFWHDIRDDEKFVQHPSRVAFPVGVGVDGQLLISDFADPNTCHSLVAGTSGSGKSEFLKAMVASLVARNTSETLKITLVDPKILTFGELQTSQHLTGPIISDLSDAIICLEKAVEDMESRYQQLGRENFVQLSERFAAGLTDMPFRVIVFDEFADLVLAGKAEKKQFEDLVARLAAKGRAAGLHLVLATQRPDREIVTGKIKANLPLRICLKVTSAINSQIILDEPGGETLVGRGDLLCNRGKGIERAQSSFLPRGELKKLSA